MRDVLLKIVEEAEIGPKDFLDIKVLTRDRTEFLIRSGVPEEVKAAVEKGVVVRALVNGGWSHATSSIVTVNEVRRLVENVVKVARTVGDARKKKISVSSVKGEERTLTYPFKEDLRSVSIDDKLKEVLRYENSIRGFSPRISSTVVKYIDNVSTELVVNSFGVNSEFTFQDVLLFSYVTASEAGVRTEVLDTMGKKSGFEMISRLDLEEKGAQMAKNAVELLNAEAPPSGKFTTVLDNELTGVFTHEAFGHNCEGDAVQAGRSIVEGKIGEQVGSELVSVVDDPTLPGAYGSYIVDSEGTLARRRILVEKGVLKEFLHSLESAAMVGGEANGAARAYGPFDVPIVRMSNTFIEAGDWSPEEIISETREGVYLTGTLGGYVEPVKGQFSFFCQGGYYIKNGELKGRFRKVSMSGLTLEVLKNTDAVGRDLKIGFGNFCGKDGQLAPTEIGGPHIRVKGIVVGGM